MNNSSNQIVKSYSEFWTRFLDVKGRSNRPDFWHPFWINFLISSLLGIFSAGTLSSVFAIIILIPSFTVMVRRLHDTNRTMLLAIVAHISGFITLVASISFILAVIVVVANTESHGLLGATLMASIFGTVVAGIVTLYTLYVLIASGNKEPNRYGNGGSCVVNTQNDK
ncbi:DUF805 domain-containing protein [Staphylococcus taiwanensis]|nr:DUF805 domain-containing protein [Staphylococcus taiwanensis]